MWEENICSQVLEVRFGNENLESPTSINWDHEVLFINNYKYIFLTTLLANLHTI
jgi:hypothetical protein